MNIDFEKIYKISLNALRINRSHPEVPRDMKWILQFILLHGIFTGFFVVLSYNIFLFVRAGDYSEACRNGILSVIYVVVTFTYFIVVLKQDNLNRIMGMMKEDFNRALPYDEKAIMLEYAKKGAVVCRQWIVVTLITVTIIFLKHAIVEIHLYVTGEPELLMPFPLNFPSPIEEIKMQPLFYTFNYSVMLYYGMYGSCMYTAFVPLGPSFILHACGQLEIVKKRAADLFTNTEEEEVRRKFVEIVKHLQYIYGFVDCIKDSFKVIYEVTIKGSAILLPITLYQLLTAFNRGEFSVEFIAFIFAGTLISSSPCYYSDMLMEKGEDVRFAIYSCGWEKVYDQRVRTTIVLVLQRALRPISIRTMFRTVCLDALTDMFRQSYAIFNVMNAAWG